MNIEELLGKPYWIVDIFPRQVSENAGGQYFKIEQYYLKRLPLLRRKYVDMLLKLNSYFDFEVSHDGESWARNPAPETFEQWISACMSENPTEPSLYVSVESGKVLMMMESGDTYMTVYNPTDEILSMICLLATSSGLFVWQPNKLV